MTAVPDRLRGLDHRRGRARRRAPVWFFRGAAVTGAIAATLVILPVAGAAWLWARFTDTDIADAPVWGWGTAAIVGVGLLVVLLTVLGAVRHGLRGAPLALLRGVGAGPVPPEHRDRLTNVVEGLALGLGVPPPELAVIDDIAPNALSVRIGSRRTLVVTRGLLEVPRDELEAVCAHEFAHLHAQDARWVSAAEASLAQVRREALGLLVIGFAVIGLSMATFTLIGVPVGIAITVAAGLMARSVGLALPRLRAESDAIADVAAIQLARNPEALGAVCRRLAQDTERVDRAPDRAQAAWFKAVPEATTSTHPDPSLPPEVRARLLEAMAKPREVANRGPAAELVRRAEAAYQEAGVTPPVLESPG